MKYIFIIITTLAFILKGPAQAQNINPDKNNYLVLSKNIQQLKPIILTVTELAKEDGDKYGDFFVIICGQTVKDLPNNNDFNLLLQKVKALNIKVFVCGISLKNSISSRPKSPMS